MKKPKTSKVKKAIKTAKASELARRRVLTKTSCRSSKHRANKRGMPWGFNDYHDFEDHMGLRPSPAHTLDRIDNAKGYVKGNLRWATKAEQAANRSITIRISYQDKTLTAWEFAQLLGVSVDAIYRSIRRGESPEQIAFHAREARASKVVPDPWPWPADDQEQWERSYKDHAHKGESRENFYYRLCSERYTAMMRMMIRPAGNVEPTVIGQDDETGQPIYESEPLPPGFHDYLEQAKRMLADAEAKVAATARRTTDPFASLFRLKGRA